MKMCSVWLAALGTMLAEGGGGGRGGGGNAGGREAVQRQKPEKGKGGGMGRLGERAGVGVGGLEGQGMSLRVLQLLTNECNSMI